MTLRTALLGTALAVAFSGAANAAQLNGWYISLEGGADWIDEWSHKIDPGAVPAGANFELGWTVLASVGYAFPGNWRAEFEAGFRSNDLDAYTTSGAPGIPTTGDVWEASFMLNLLYDIPLTDDFSLSLGAGAGGDFAEATFGPPSLSVDDWNFAYQGIAGLNFAVGRQTALTLSYRYFRVHEPDFDFSALAGLVLNGDDFVKHTVTVGLRYSLEEPTVFVEPAAGPPPPPVADAPSLPPQQFIVFFGFNKYNLTSEALRVISEAVIAAKQTGSARLVITGHTDTVGSHQFNERLSMRRANTVKAEMVRQGIPTAAIGAIGKGETELLVQTADGVKEPQNRRATIDLN